MFAVTAFSAKAQDFSATVSWDVPGSIQVLKGSSPSYSTPVEIEADATSFTVTEKADYIFMPAEDYFIDAATMDDQAQNLTKDWATGTMYFKLAAQYSSSKFNEKTVVLTIKKYEIVGEFTLDIQNGAASTTFQLQDSKGNTTATITPEDGVNTFSIRNVDAKLYFKASGYPAPAFYLATNNGEAIEQQTNGSYLTDITPGAEIKLALKDPASIKNCTVKFVFTNDNADCINTIRDWSLGAFIQDKLSASNWETVVESGTKLAINIKEDYTLNSITTDPAVEFVKPADTQIVSGTQFIISDDTVITIDATSISYEDKTATIYTNNAAGLIFTSEYGLEESDLTLTEVAEKEADTVTFEKVGFTIPVATTEYTLSGISGKTNRFFFAVKPGFYLAGGAFANMEKTEGDADDYYKLNGAASASVDNCPLFLEVRKIGYTTPAVLYFQGTEGSSARVLSSTSEGENASYEGQTSTLAEGYSQIMFDPEYNTAFSVRVYTTSSTDKYYVYVDGVAATASSESDMVFEGLKLGENSVVKTFIAKTAPATHTLNFTVEDDAAATLTYDKYVTISEFPASIKNVGDVEYTFVPAEGTKIFVNGEELAAPYTFTAAKGDNEIKIVGPTSGVDSIASEDGKYTVITLTGIVVLKDVEASAIANLPKGIYIINGKKVAVK